MNWDNEVVLITGATSGLGQALAIRAGELGATVVMIARRKNVLKMVAKEIKKAHYFDFDLINTGKIPSLFKKIEKEINSEITVLINNVGFQVAGFVQNTSVEVYERNYRINTLAPVALIQAVIPGMLQKGRGVIGNVMSSIMYHSFPCVSCCASSKEALGAIHESLRMELVDKPINTIMIMPGSFKSNYWESTEVEDRIRDYTLPNIDEMNDPAIVARKIYEAIEKGKNSIDLGTYKDKIGQHLSYWAPGVLEKIIVSRNRKLIDNYPDEIDK